MFRRLKRRLSPTYWVKRAIRFAIGTGVVGVIGSGWYFGSQAVSSKIEEAEETVNVGVFENIANSLGFRVTESNPVSKLTDTANGIQEQISESLSSLMGATESKEKTTATANKKGTKLEVTFVDVGQGDAILIKDKGKYMLIDTGKSSGREELYNVLESNNVETISTMILTHPDADHIQLAGDIIEDYGVKSIYMPTVESDSSSYKFLKTNINNYDVAVYNPIAGDTISFGAKDTSYTFVGPVTEDKKAYDDTNSYSLILKLEKGKDSFLFTGDATGDETDDILSAGINVDADVLKIAHHGSANEGCNDETFINKVSPDTVVISCALGNSYGHPHKETMALIKEKKYKLYRTDLQGTITATSSGKGIKWSKKPCKDYSNGSSK